MNDQDIVGAGAVQSHFEGGSSSGLRGRRKARLRGGMERSDEYRLLPSAAKVVISAVWELADTPKGTQPWVHARFKVSTLAERCGLSRSQIHRWLNRIDHRRLEERLSKGLDPEPGWLGPWIRTWCVKGRFLGVTAFATPSSPEARNRVMDMSKRRSQVKIFNGFAETSGATGCPLDDTPDVEQATQQMSPRCDNDNPPLVSTSTTHPVGCEPDPRAEKGWGEVDQKNPSPAIEEGLRRLGVRPEMASMLAQDSKVVSAGMEAIRTTLNAIKGSQGVRDPIATLVHRLRTGQITTRSRLGRLPPPPRIDLQDPEIVEPDVSRWIIRLSRSRLSGFSSETLISNAPKDQQGAVLKALRILEAGWQGLPAKQSDGTPTSSP